MDYETKRRQDEKRDEVTFRANANRPWEDQDYFDCHKRTIYHVARNKQMNEIYTDVVPRNNQKAGSWHD